MANTITSKTLLAGKNIAIVYVTIASDGTEETATVLYDSSAVATSAGDDDTLDSTILSIYASVSAAGPVAAAAGARVKLLWDATTDVLAIDIPTGTNPTKANFRRIGGLPNQGGTGKTGDILITTTGLEAGDAITLVLEVRRD